MLNNKASILKRAKELEEKKAKDMEATLDKYKEEMVYREEAVRHFSLGICIECGNEQDLVYKHYRFESYKLVCNKCGFSRIEVGYRNYELKKRLKIQILVGAIVGILVAIIMIILGV